MGIVKQYKPLWMLNTRPFARKVGRWRVGTLYHLKSPKIVVPLGG